MINCDMMNWSIMIEHTTDWIYCYWANNRWKEFLLFYSRAEVLCLEKNVHLKNNKCIVYEIGVNMHKWVVIFSFLLLHICLHPGTIPNLYNETFPGIRVRIDKEIWIKVVSKIFTVTFVLFIIHVADNKLYWIAHC